MEKIKKFFRRIRRLVRRTVRKELFKKALIVISSLAILATTILPYII